MWEHKKKNWNYDFAFFSESAFFQKFISKIFYTYMYSMRFERYVFVVLKF